VPGGRKRRRRGADFHDDLLRRIDTETRHRRESLHGSLMHAEKGREFLIELLHVRLNGVQFREGHREQPAVEEMQIRRGPEGIAQLLRRGRSHGRRCSRRSAADGHSQQGESAAVLTSVVNVPGVNVAGALRDHPASGSTSPWLLVGRQCPSGPSGNDDDSGRRIQQKGAPHAWRFIIRRRPAGWCCRSEDPRSMFLPDLILKTTEPYHRNSYLVRKYCRAGAALR